VEKQVRQAAKAAKLEAGGRYGVSGLMHLFLVVACFTQTAVAQQNPSSIRAFVPPAAVVKQQLSLDLENDGIPEAALVYTILTNRTRCTTMRESRS